MACPGGCVMGGGQPIKDSKTRATVDVRALRANSLYELDEKSTIRKSHLNPNVKAIYDEYLGKPGGELSHKYLHTHYKKEEKYNISFED
jgi:iron only hydrogenase large subunit-like protein